MEFVVVRFPDPRPVNVNGAPQGTTGKVIRLQAGTHRFDLGAPVNYRPSSQTVQVSGTTKSTPLEVEFTPRLAAAARRRKTTAAGARKTGRAKRTTPTAPARPATTRRIAFITPTRSFELKAPDGDEATSKLLQQAAMRWTYVLRNRERWAALPVTAKKHAEACRDLLNLLGVSEEDLDVIARDRMLEIAVPYAREAEGWETRIFPWEYVVAGATRDARRGVALTVLRRLVMGRRPAARSASQRVLYVESTPGKLRDLFSFATECALVRSNLRPKKDEWRELKTPTLQTLEQIVKTYRPDIIHLAGFDSHQGLRLIRPLTDRRNVSEESPPRTESEGDTTPDGYLLADSRGEPTAIDAVTLAKALCTNGHRPELVAFNLQNSAARVAAMAVAHGAHAALGFQDVFDDTLAELFFGSFYRSWRKRDWDLAQGFRDAWETVRGQPSSVTGSGLVLWSARPLVTPAARMRTAAARREPETPTSLFPGQLSAEDAPKVISSRIEPLGELNYSVLHNRCALFNAFTLVNNSADYKNRDQLSTLCDIDVTVTLNAGTESATYQRTLSLDNTSVDLKDLIHVPLTSELMRSVHESINSSLLVEVSWGKVIYRDSHLVRLLPVDQWRDNDRDGQWLPSFVLPRDPSVGALIDQAQRYVRVLRDNPSAGFDGYQSVDPRAADPSAEVDRQVQAIWSTIVHELNLGYINPPPSYSSAMDSQRLRTPSMIVKDRSGTCIDLALLLAACCELIDVYPVLFLLKDHAFPGYWRDAVHQQQFIDVADEFVQEMATEQPHTTTAPGAQRVAWWFRDTAYDEIVRQVQLGHLVPLESVWLTEHSGFFDAVQGGKDNLKKRSRFHSMLDIARAREAGVTPLPFGLRV